jgi:hypothetical protein
VPGVQRSLRIQRIQRHGYRRNQAEGRVSEGSQIVARFWSLGLVAVIVLALVLSNVQSEPVRAIASAGCIGLLVHSWFMLRRYAPDRRRLWLITLALCLPTLAFVWLGLNVIRFYTYPGDSDSGVYGQVIQLQSGIQWGFAAVACVVVLWAIFELVHTVVQRISTSRERRLFRCRPCGDSVVPTVFPALTCRAIYISSLRDLFPAISM